VRRLSVAQRLRASRSGDRLAIWRITHPGLRPGWSLLGLAITLGLLTVAWIVQARTGAASAPVILLVAASAGAFVAAAVVGLAHRAIAPLLVAIAVSWVAYDWRADLTGGPLSGPFGYRNAFGALLLQGALAWLLAGFGFTHPLIRALSAIPAAVLGFLAVRSSAATAAGLVLVLVALLSLAGRAGARAAVVLCGLATAAFLASTLWLGAVYEPGRPQAGIAARVADAGITERRLTLWHDALAIAADQPAGIGHGQFGRTSPTALEDRDTIYAHNEFLEQAAELGWAGMVLTVLLVAWLFLRLAITPGADAVTALSAVALAGLAIHGSVDYVWHFPAVPLAAAALIGTGLVPPRERSHR
jgi:O-antigen ligase